MRLPQVQLCQSLPRAAPIDLWYKEIGLTSPPAASWIGSSAQAAELPRPLPAGLPVLFPVHPFPVCPWVPRSANPEHRGRPMLRHHRERDPARPWATWRSCSAIPRIPRPGAASSAHRLCAANFLCCRGALQAGPQPHRRGDHPGPGRLRVFIDHGHGVGDRRKPRDSATAASSITQGVTPGRHGKVPARASTPPWGRTCGGRRRNVHRGDFSVGSNTRHRRLDRWCCNDVQPDGTVRGILAGGGCIIRGCASTPLAHSQLPACGSQGDRNLMERNPTRSKSNLSVCSTARARWPPGRPAAGKPAGGTSQKLKDREIIQFLARIACQ